MSERLQSTYRRGEYTPGHFTACTILNKHHILYLSEYVIHAWGFFDYKNRLVSFKPDIIIIDPNYGCGIIHVEGEGSKSKDNESEDKILMKLGFEWIEHLANEGVTDIMDVLERHKREVLEFP